MPEISIGNINVVLEGTTNPYKSSVYGKERSSQLGRFLRGLPTPGYEFWFAPVCGGARKLSTSEDVNVDPDVINYYWDEKGLSTRR